MRGRLRIWHASVPPIVRVDVVPVASQQLREVTADLDAAAWCGEDGTDGEEQAVRVVLLVVRDRADVRPQVRCIERAPPPQVAGQIFQRLARDGRLAREDEEPERPVEGDLLLEVHHVGVHHARHVSVCEKPARPQFGALGMHQARLNRVSWRPIERVGPVGHAVAAGELAGLLEGLDEVVVLGRDLALRFGRRLHLAGSRRPLREQFGVLVIEREQRLRDLLPLRLVGSEDVSVGQPSFHRMNFPCQVLSIEEGSVHALAGFGLHNSTVRTDTSYRETKGERAYAVSMAGVSAEEDAMVQGVTVRDTLTDGIHRVPFDPLPIYRVGGQDLLGRCLHLFRCGGLAGVPVRVCGRGDLNVEPHHVGLTGNNHDGAVRRVYCAFHLGPVSDDEEPRAEGLASYLDVWEIRLDNPVHDTPDMRYRIFVGDADLELVSHEGFPALSAEEVLCPDRFPRRTVDMFQLDLDGVLRVGRLIDTEALDGPGSLYLGTVFLHVGDENALDETLVQEGGEGVPGIDEAGAACPRAGPGDALAVPWGVPEGDLVDSCRLVGHDVGFETHVPEQIQRPGLDAICATRRGGLGSVVNMFDLVPPSCQAGREHEPYRPSAYDD